MNVTTQNLEAMLLARLMLSDAPVCPVRAIVAPAHFAEPAHADIYQAICDRADAGLDSNPVSLRPMLDGNAALRRLGGSAYLAQLVSSGVAIMPEIATDLAAGVRDAALKRLRAAEPPRPREGDTVAAYAQHEAWMQSMETLAAADGLRTLSLRHPEPEVRAAQDAVASQPAALVEPVDGLWVIYRKVPRGFERPRWKSSRMPRFRHQSMQAAVTEAERLVGLHPACTFVILREVVTVRATEPNAPTGCGDDHGRFAENGA